MTQNTDSSGEPLIVVNMEAEDVRSGLTQEQIKTLEQFRVNVQDVLTKPEHDDFYLLRWLRARCFNLKESEEMLRKSLVWRRKWKVDTILTNWTPNEVLVKYFPSGMFGHDKMGHPVWIFPAKGLHMKSLSLSAKKSDIIRYMIYLLEQILEDCRLQSTKLGRRIDKAVMVVDLDGFTLKQLFMPGTDIVFRYLAMVEANYPETLQSVFVFNGPFIVPILFRLVKPLLSDDTKKKIAMLGKDWKEKLLSHIDADQLPAHWGGTVTDPDGNPYCCSKVCLGGEVPPEYHIKGSDLVDESKVTKKVISKGDTLELPFRVTGCDQVLRWVFWTENHDISFGLQYKPDSDGPVEQIIPDSRINCQRVPEDGLHRCDRTGTYIVKFDNSYSWLYSKRLSYSIQVVNMADCDTQSLLSSCSSVGP